MNIPFYGLARQYAKHKDEFLAASHEALKDGQWVTGKFTSEFELWLRVKTGARYALTVASGTQALEIIARHVISKRQFPSKNILIPDLTYPATMNAFATTGWDITLGDTDKFGILDTKNIQPNSMICVVGLYGKQPDFATGGCIVDGAQHWLVANSQIGHGMAISFDPTKNLPSSGNGGAIVTDDITLYNFALSYRNNGIIYNSYFGTNSKMSEQDCAQILVRTKYINRWQKRRTDIARYWCDRFKSLPISCLNEEDSQSPFFENPSITHAHHKFVIYTSDRNSLHTNLLLDGVNTKIHYGRTLSELDLPNDNKINKLDLMSMSAMLSRGVLSLPIFPELTDIEVEYISDRVRRFYQSTQ